MKRLLATTVVALLLPASAQALTVEADNGQRCTLNTITQPTQFGLTVAPCIATRASSVSFLLRDGNVIVATTDPTNTRLPYSNVGSSSRPGTKVRIDFAVFLPPNRPRLHWRKRTGGDVCRRLPRRERKVLNCQLIVPVG